MPQDPKPGIVPTVPIILPRIAVGATIALLVATVLFKLFGGG